MKTDKFVPPDMLATFAPLDKFDAEQLLRLSRKCYFETLLAGEQVVRHGARDPWSYFLVTGEVIMEAPGREDEQVAANSERAKRPLNYTKPCQWAIRAAGSVVIFRVSDAMLASALRGAPAPDKLSDTSPQSEELMALQLMEEIERDSRANQLKIPSLPDVALQVQAAIKRETSDVAEVARIVMVDPPLAGRLMQVANSPMYRGKSAITTCQAAIARMGLKVTRDLVIGCSLQQMFKSESPLLKRFMQKAWQHSTRVAALCAVISRHAKGVDEDRAMLAGLVHDIGTLPIIHYAANYPELVEDEAALNKVINKLSAEVGVQVLRRWEFDLELIDVVRGAHEWYRDSGPAPDYCDVVLLAQLYSFINTAQMASHPSIDVVPAFSKFSLGQLEPQMVLRVLEAAQEDIDAIEQVLQGR